MIQEHDYAFKVVIVGNQGVGKSCLFLRFCDRNFFDNYLTTIGVDFRFKRHEVDGLVCKLQIWDTAGQERFRTITSAYYRSSQAVLIVFSLNDPQSFADIQNYWLQEAKNNSDPDQVICIVGSKSDMEWKVSKENVENFCRNAGLNFFFISAKTGEGVDQMFTTICQKLIKVSKMRQPKSKNKKGGANRITSSFLKEDEDENKKSGCCKQ